MDHNTISPIDNDDIIKQLKAKEEDLNFQNAKINIELVLQRKKRRLMRKQKRIEKQTDKTYKKDAPIEESLIDKYSVFLIFGLLVILLIAIAKQ